MSMNFYPSINMLDFCALNYLKCFTGEQDRTGRTASGFLSEKSLRLLCVAFINSNLLYCRNIVGCASKTTQKKPNTEKSNSNSNYVYTAPLFTKINMLTYENILKFNKLSFMHSIEYQYAHLTVHGTKF